MSCRIVVASRAVMFGPREEPFVGLPAATEPFNSSAASERLATPSWKGAVALMNHRSSESQRNPTR